MNKNNMIYVISFFSGFLSLAQEVLWMRIISFAGMSVPQTFSYTLALFLTGIALGAQVGKKICKDDSDIQLPLLGRVLLLAAVVDVILIVGVIFFAKFYDLSIYILGVCVLCSALVRGIIFPIVHHVGASCIKSGAQISNVYFSNVFGSALAPLLISFIALKYLNTQQVYLILCLITAGVGLLCLDHRKYKIATLAYLTLLLIGIFQPEKIFYELSKNSYSENLYPIEVVENQHGIIQIYDDHNDQVVFGANVYDGKFNTNLFHNTNGIDRAYLLAALKPEAENILVIGLSTGSWAKVLSYLPNIKKMTIIEINPAYVEIIKKNPMVQDLLKDDRIEIVIDDGRKWLKKSEQKNFDIILMNTTWHWRAYGSSLLSQDFLKLIHTKMHSSSLFFYNTTQSIDAYQTAYTVFPNVYKYKFMVLASLKPVHPKHSTLAKNLCLLKDGVNHRQIFHSNAQCAEAANIIEQQKFTLYQDLDLSSLASRTPEIITDNNMIVEYKYGKGL